MFNRPRKSADELAAVANMEKAARVLVSAQQTGDAALADAQHEAEQIIAAARREAEEIREAARAEERGAAPGG